MNCDGDEAGKGSPEPQGGRARRRFRAEPGPEAHNIGMSGENRGGSGSLPLERTIRWNRQGKCRGPSFGPRSRKGAVRQSRSRARSGRRLAMENGALRRHYVSPPWVRSQRLPVSAAVRSRRTNPSIWTESAGRPTPGMQVANPKTPAPGRSGPRIPRAASRPTF